MSAETTTSPFLFGETEQPDNTHAAVCPKPHLGKAERLDLLIGLRLLGTQGQTALIQYIQTKQAQKEQKGTVHVSGNHEQDSIGERKPPTSFS
jgi:hypothetical protein